MGKNFCKVEGKWCKLCKRNKNSAFTCYYNNCNTELKNIRKCPKVAAGETISLRNLLKNINFYDIMTEIIKLRPSEKKNVIGYAKVYDDLLKIKGVKSSGMLRCINEHYEDCDCISIYGVYNHKEYAIDFLPWAEWVTMNIEQETLDKFTYDEIAAAALWEITYNGFTEERIEIRKHEIYESLKDIENEND